MHHGAWGGEAPHLPGFLILALEAGPSRLVSIPQVTGRRHIPDPKAARDGDMAVELKERALDGIDLAG